MRYQLLLLQDVKNLGRKGDLVTAKPGFARNFLIPSQRAVRASKGTLRMREALQKERQIQAEKDQKVSKEIALKLKDITLTIEVKVDPEGHMYGSVSILDIVELLKGAGYDLGKKAILLAHPIKKLGVYQINLALPEGVEAYCALEVKPDRVVKKAPEPKKEEATAETEEKVEEKKTSE